MTANAYLHGVVVPMLTPLDADEELDRPAVARLVDHLVAGGVDTLFLLGSNGEGATLRPRVGRALVEAAIEAADGRVPVVVGALEPGTRRVIDAMDALADLPIEAFVVCAPYYYRGSSEEELHGHFAAIADAAPRPVVLYNLPQVTGYPMSPALVLRLADHPNIVGLKDSSADWDGFQELVASRPPGFALLHGDQERCADTMLLGAEGLVPGYANVWPQVFRDVVETARAGDEAGARRAQAAIDRLLAVRGRATSHANKVLAAELGLMQDHMTLPLPRLSAEEARAVVAASREAGLPLDPRR